MIVINDLHMFSTHSCYSSVTDLALAYGRRSDVILAGDIIDLQNCKKKEIEAAEQAIELLIYAFGKRYLTGNHELRTGNKYYVDSKTKTLYTHGHWELWGESKAMAYMERNEPGAGFLKRAVLPLFDHGRKFKKFTLDAEQEQSIRRVLDKFECKRYVCGHAHVRKRIETDFYTILPRGINFV